MKKYLLLLFKTTIFIISIIMVYLLAVLILPLISVNNKKQIEKSDLITIYILTNGMHTDVVLPVKTELIDWSTIIPFSDTKSKKTYKNIAFGWGDKGFYLETPEWSDLKFSTAFKATFGIGSTAMHTTFYDDLYQNKNCRRIKLSKDEYKNLTQFIKESFVFDSNGKVQYIKTDALYGDNDSFYDAKGKYSLFYTCNTWAANALKSAKQKSPLWTATQQGIFYHYR